MRRSETPERRAGNESGAAVVEAALALSLLFLTLFGMMEFGTLFFNKAILDNASREGARFGSLFNVDPSDNYAVSPYSDSQIEQRVEKYSQVHLLSFASGTSLPTVGVSPAWASRKASGPGTPLSVQVQYTFDWLLLPELAAGLTGQPRLESQTRMRME